MRALAALAAGICLLGLPACAPVQTGVVWDSDSWSRTVQIGPESYRVTGDTHLFGPGGERISFDEIPTIADAGIGVRAPQRAEVDFVVTGQAEGGSLDALWVRHR